MVFIHSNDIMPRDNLAPLSNNFLHIFRLVTKETMEARNKGEELREIVVSLLSRKRRKDRLYTKNMR